MVFDTGLMMVFDTGLMMVFVDDVSNVFSRLLVYWTITLALRIPVNHVTRHFAKDHDLYITQQMAYLKQTRNE